MNFLSTAAQMMGSMLADWPFGTIIGTLFLICVLFIVLFFTWFFGSMLFAAADSCFLPQKQDMGRVVNMKFTPAHRGEPTLRYDETTKLLLPHRVYYPDNWSVTVEMGGQRYRVSVNENFYQLVSKDSRLLVRYAQGRFSGEVYIKNLVRT